MSQNIAGRNRWLSVLSEKCRREFEGKKLESHDLSHSLRVWRNAEKLGQSLGADMEVLIAAVFLHDVGVIYTTEVNHGAKSMEVAEIILNKIGFPKNKIPQVLEAIESHDDPKKERRSLEAKILFDCDNMDAFGAIGVFRYLDIYVRRGWNITKIAEHVCENVQERFRSLYFKQSAKMCREDYEFTKKLLHKTKK
ncbi:MAG: HD domain-containing protein [Candidatus Micrarchaeia archaeon]